MSPLKPHQVNALVTLASNPGAWVPAGTLGMLRKAGLAGKVKGRPAREGEHGWQRTTSPITEAGRAPLAEQGMLPLEVKP